MTENVKFFKLIRDILTDKITQLIPENPDHIEQEFSVQAFDTDQKINDILKPTIRKSQRKQHNKS